MMEFLSEYGLFLAKIATWVIATLIIFFVLFALAAKSKGKQKGTLSIKKINKKYDEYIDIINETSLNKEELKQIKQHDKKAIKTKKKRKAKSKPRIFLMHFHGDIAASAVASLREEITAVLLAARPRDEVLLQLDSGGGMVHAYGLAASQLQRLKDAKVRLVIAVDKVAASGGYMMACVADQLIAAPFAVIGSIGVLAQLPNFHRYLQKKNIDFEQLTAGEYKRTLTMFGENTKQGRNKMQDDIDDTHELFKTFIKEHREQVELDKVATGEHWYGTKALELNLVDHIQTSDDYILHNKDRFDIYRIQYKIKKPLGKRFAQTMESSVGKLISPSAGRDYLP